MLTTCDIPFDWSCVHVLLLTVSPSARSTDHEFDRAPDRSYDRSSHVHLFGYHKQPRHHAKVDHPWERLGWSIHLSLDFHAVLDFNLVGHGQKPVSFFQFGFTRPSDRYRGHPVTTLDQSNRTLTHVLIQLVSSNTCSQSAMKPMFTCSQCATSPPAASFPLRPSALTCSALLRDAARYSNLFGGLLVPKWRRHARPFV